MGSLNRFLGNMLGLALLAAVSFGGYFAYQTYHAHDLALRGRDAQIEEQAEEIDRLGKDVAVKQQQIDRLQVAMRLLKVDHRVAQVLVLDQFQPPGSDKVRTKFRFVEVNGDRAIDRPREFTIDGDILYIDALVVKFADEHVEQGDPLRATSVCLFRRLFGEYQQPSDGYPLDPVGARPKAYGQDGTMTALEESIWSNFWQYANDKVKAEAEGIRALHGEAPFIQLVKGKLYEVELRASGGLTIKPKELSPAAASGAT